VNNNQKADAVKLAHLKTFTADPLLHSYYAKVEEKFKEKFEAAVRKYFPFHDASRQKLKKEIEKINGIIGKLDPIYGSLLQTSLVKYSNHVKKANHNVFQDFLIPLPITGLTDY
jgi:hypothetical protein